MTLADLILNAQAAYRSMDDPAMCEADFIADFISTDVEPVRHGRWEWLGPNELVRGCMCGTCSACKVRSKYIVNTDICPNCGARMNGGADND